LGAAGDREEEASARRRIPARQRRARLRAHLPRGGAWSPGRASGLTDARPFERAPPGIDTQRALRAGGSTQPLDRQGTAMAPSKSRNSFTSTSSSPFARPSSRASERESASTAISSWSFEG